MAIRRGSEVVEHDDPVIRHEQNPKFFMERISQSNIWQYLVSTIYYFWESGFSISIQGIVFVIVVSMCTDDVPNVTQVVLSGLHPMPTRLFQQLTICESQHWR